MAQTSSKIISNALLLFSSYLGLKVTTRGLKYARAAFKLYFITSAVGVISSLMSFVALQDLDEMVWVWCYCLGIPLLATDLCTLSPYIPDISPFHLAIPLYTVLAYHMNPKHIDALLLSISHSVSILFLAISAAWDGHFSGVALSFIHFFSMFRVTDENARLNWTMLITSSNFLTLNVIVIATSRLRTL